MADSEKTKHVTTSKMELFCARVLDEAELHTIARHLSNCADCGQQFVATLGRQKVGTTPVSFTLAPEFWLRHEHLAYEQLVEFTENKLEAADRELIDVHLETCAPCREDVQGFLAFRKEIAPEMKVSYAPVVLEPASEKLSWWNSLSGLTWKPIYTATVVLIGIALLIAVVFLKRRADDFQARQTPSPNVNLASSSPTPTPSAPPNESPVKNPDSTDVLVALNDRGGRVTVDANGNLSGLDDVPASTRTAIAKALLSERLERPSILKELGGQGSALRGSNDRQPFKLISPARTVLVSDRPTFKWEKLAAANSYRVYVSGPDGSVVATSEQLSADRVEWKVTKPLQRGLVHSWSVIGVVDDKEIVSPGPSSPEMKFRVLSDRSLQQLNMLKKMNSHLALGVFFAREGMISEAEREFQLLVNNNPSSPQIRKFLRDIQAWQTR